MILVLILKFWFLEIFQKSPGGLCIAARRLIPTICVWCVSGGSTWRWNPVSPGDANEWWNSGLIFMSSLAVMNFCQATRVCWLDFLVLCFLGDFWSMKKVGIGSYKIMGVVFCWFSAWMICISNGTVLGLEVKETLLIDLLMSKS